MLAKEWWSKHWQKGFKINEAVTEHIVRFTKSRFQNISDLIIFEIGFGSGREIIYFASHGCYCYGIEVSNEHCMQVVEKIPENLRKNIELASFQKMKLPKENSVDLLYALETLHYFESKEEICKYINSLINFMKPNSWCFFSLVHPEHFFCKVSDRIDKEKRMFNNNYKNREGLNFILYETDKELMETFSPCLTNINIGNYAYIYHDNNYRKFWVVTGQPIKI